MEYQAIVCRPVLLFTSQQHLPVPVSWLCTAVRHHVSVARSEYLQRPVKTLAQSAATQHTHTDSHTQKQPEALRSLVSCPNVGTALALCHECRCRQRSILAAIAGNRTHFSGWKMICQNDWNSRWKCDTPLHVKVSTCWLLLLEDACF